MSEGANLPSGWIELLVEDAVENISTNGKKTPQKQYLESGCFPIVDQGQELIGGFTDDANKLVDCEPPAIVFGDHTKVVKLIKQPFAPGADGVKVLKPHAFYDVRAFKIFLDHLAADLIDKGYARHYQHLAIRRIPLPPLAEQKRIVAKIEELFSELDAGEESLRRARRQLGVYRQSLLKQAFEGKLTAPWRAQHPDLLESPDQLLARIQAERQSRYEERIKEWDANGKRGRKPRPPGADDQEKPVEADSLPTIPKGWHWRRLDQIAEIGTGMSVSKSRTFDDPIEVPYLRVANVQRGSLDLTELKTMQVERGKLDDLRLKPGDVLFNEGGDRDKLGRGWVWSGLPEPCITQNHVFRATIASETVAIPEFVSHWGNGFGQDFFHLTGKQTTNLASISKAVLSSLPLPIPPVAEQREILRLLDEQFEVIEQNEREIDAALKRSEALRQSILKKAFTGHLVPQDPTDEPASTLLARIRAEREAAAKPARKQTTKKARP